MSHNKIRELSSGGDTGGSIRFTGRNTTVALPPRKMPKLLIKGTLAQIGEGSEFEDDIVYLFQVSPLGQDKNGDDRVFTFNCYSKKSHRTSAKHSAERKHLASLLRKRHTNLWDRFHEAMGTR